MKRVALLALWVMVRAAWSAPVSVIYDSDIGPDCDDVGALTVLHSLADRGEARLLATVCCTSSPWGAPCLDALNTWFGRPEIPVGTLRATGFLSDPGPYQERIALSFPHRVATGAEAADAVELYRRVLAAQPDQSVVVIAVGPLPNLRNLLASPADAHSPLDGAALVARKVIRLACMGGAYPASAAGRDGEWNFAMDGPAARAVAERWPTPILYSGYEIGGGLMTGRRLALDTPEYGPLATAYGLYIGYGRDRESWDLTAALAGVRGGADLWPISAPGTCQVDDKGHNSFAADAKGRHTYLVRREPAQPIEDALEELLVSAKHGPLSLDHDLALFALDGYGTTSASDGEAARAFDRKPDTVWYAAGRESWLRYDLADGRAAAVAAYSVTVPDEQPRSWALEASADGGATWTRLDAHTAEPLRGAGPRTFRLTNAVAYAAYRLHFTAGEKAQVGELALLEHIEAKPGVAVVSLKLDRATLSLPAAGRAALNVTALPANTFDPSVAWTSDNPAVAEARRIGDHTAMVVGVGAGRCQVSARSADGKRTAGCAVTVTPMTLPAPWRLEEVNAPHVPAEARFADGTFTLTGGGMGIGRWWKRNWDQFALLSQPRDGDWAITARIGAPSRSSDGALAGLMCRESLDRESRFVAVGVQPSGEAVLTWRDSPADENPRTTLGKLVLPVWLRLQRTGDTFTVSTSADGVTWGEPLGRHAGAFTPRQKVGLWVTADRNPTTSTARFEQVRVD